MSGFFSSLPFLRGSAPLPQLSPEQQAVKILVSNADFPDSPKPFAIQAEVVSQNPDKSLILKTDYGEVTVRSKGNEKFEPGQQFRLDVPAGKGSRAGREALLSPPDTLKNVAPPPRTSPASGPIGPAPSPEIPDEGILKPTIPPTRGSTPSKEAGAVLTQARAASSILADTKLPPPVRLEAGNFIRLNVIPKEALTALMSGNISVNAAQAPVSIPSIMALISPQVFRALQLPASAFHQPYQGFSLPQPQVPAQTPIITDTPLMRAVPSQNAGINAAPVSPQGAINAPDVPLIQPVQGQGGGQDDGRALLSVPKTQAGQNQGASGQMPLTQMDGKIVQMGQAQTGQNQMLLQGRTDSLSFRIAAFQPNGQPVLVPLNAQNGQVPQQGFTLNIPVTNLQEGQVITVRPDILQNASLPQSNAAQIWAGLLAELTGGGALPITSPLHGLPMMMPQVSSPSQILPSVMFLFAAIRGGGIENMIPIGKMADMDAKTQRLLKSLEVLTKDGASSLGRAVSSSTGDFRGFSFPLHYQDQFVPVSLYVQTRDDRGGSDTQSQDQDKIDATRFLFEFDLTRMGLLQIDGMIREKNLDIFVRTGRALSPQMKSTIRETYLKALEKSDLQGDVAFQTRDQNWVEIEAA